MKFHSTRQYSFLTPLLWDESLDQMNEYEVFYWNVDLGLALMINLPCPIIQGGPKKNKQNLRGRHFKSIYSFRLIFLANDPHYPRLLWWKNERNRTSSFGDRLILLTPCQKPSQQLLNNGCYVALAWGSFNTLLLSTIFCSDSFCHLSRGSWWPSRAFEEYSRV